MGIITVAEAVESEINLNKLRDKARRTSLAN